MAPLGELEKAAFERLDLYPSNNSTYKPVTTRKNEI